MIELINQEFMREYEEMEVKYPIFMKRIKDRIEWALILLNKTVKFLKKLGLEYEFKNELNSDEHQAFSIFKKIIQIEG